MEERHYVPVEEEQAAREAQATDFEYKAFLSGWTPGTAPACDEGMRLLYAFAKAQPAAFEMVSPRGFLMDEPRLGNSRYWRAFASHVTACEDCNESGHPE